MLISALELQATIADALSSELNATPKPGLVDRHNNGAHRDMDYALMKKSIETISPFLMQMAVKSQQELSVPLLQQIGIEAEKAMMVATGGVNTHKGAIFAIGLAVSSWSYLSYRGKTFTTKDWSETIATLACQIKPQQSTNGTHAVKRYRLHGALDLAQHGYDIIFDDVLTWFVEQKKTEKDKNLLYIKTLLYIVSKVDDTNLYHRGGFDVAQQVKQKAGQLCNCCTLEELELFDKQCISLNVSPGGSADLLALTILIDKLNNVI
ncbi:MAG: triphosphoribosyl-dephospho-CoA synthase [Bacteroidales bacterium]|nr:triphosphoribosyl-dephospho-CoA synthase [Bacteroidales bacterium]